MEEIVHKWSIMKLIQKYDPTKTVKRVHYRVTSSMGDLSINSDGFVDLGEPSPESFIPYESLEEDQVINWVIDALGPTRGNHEISNKTWLETKRPIYPDQIIEPLPWN